MSYSRRNLTWVRDGAEWVVRHGRTELARVVPDERYAGMWRVRTAAGRLSDMANITWAKDAAATMALAVLNRLDGVGTERGDRKVKANREPAVFVPSESERIQDPAG